jgi:hypothetical protein
MTEEWMQVIAAGLVVGLALGYFMQRESRKRQQIYGGLPAEFFHYLASAAISGLIPAIFIAIFSGLPILRIIATGMSFSLTSFLMLLLYAVFESQAEVPVQAEEIPLD